MSKQDRQAPRTVEDLGRQFKLTPPARMLPGVEYKTGKLWRGKPVYTKAVRLGRLPNAAVKEVDPEAYWTEIVSLRGTAAMGKAFFEIGTAGNAIIRISQAGMILVETAFDASLWDGTAVLEYIKEE